MKIRKKLIEVSIPLEAINAASAREKSIRHGHPSTLHLWWARRPLAACRAVLFAQLVDDPSGWPGRFDHDKEKIDAERRRLHKVIEQMVEWPSDSKPGERQRFEHAVEEARWEIARSVAWGLGEEPPAREDGAAILAYLQTKAPPVYDPFCGGGSIPLEAQRLGLRAYGSDLNPVAVLISKALVEIPPKFAGRAPVHPGHDTHRRYRGAQGLAEDVRFYGQWMRGEAERRIGHLYPKARLPDGSEATVIAWLWARTVRSPDPRAKGAMVPLVTSFVLSTKEGKKAWVEPVIDPAAPDGWRFDVQTGRLPDTKEESLKNGTKVGQGQFRCLLTGASLSEAYIRKESAEGLGAWRAIAVIAEARKGKAYLPIETAPVPEIAENLLTEIPQQQMFRGALGFRLQPYGVLVWGDFFRPRQRVALATFAKLVREVQEEIINDAQSIHRDPEAYARAVAAYLVCVLGRAVDYWTINTMWEPGGEFIIHTFSEMTIPIVWDSAEGNPFASGGGGWMKTCLDWVCRVVEVLPTEGAGEVVCAPAQEINPSSAGIFSIDPPYFDNIGYADLSDAFYVWERSPLGTIFPELARRLSTPKDDELVATAARHGGTKGASGINLTEES